MAEQVDQERDSRPAWMRAGQIRAGQISSKTAGRPLAGNTKPARKGTRKAANGATDVSSAAVFDVSTRANLNPEFLTVLDDVMGVDSDEDYEEPEPDYEDHPGILVHREHKPLAAARTTGSMRVPTAHKPLEYRHSTGGGRSKTVRLIQPKDPAQSSSDPNISSGDQLNAVTRDFAPNLRITASHQARLLREAGGQGSRAPRTGNPLKKQGLSRTQSMPTKHSGAPPPAVRDPSPDYDDVPLPPPSSSRNKVLNNLQTAMDSGWFYGYGIVVKNLKEKMKYISNHQPERAKKGIEITRHKDKVPDHAQYEAGMTRELAVEILRRQRMGSYILRDSISSPGHLAVSIKTGRGREPSVINHFLLLRPARGRVSLKGFSREWPSIKAFTDNLAQAMRGRDAELGRYLGIRL